MISWLIPAPAHFINLAFSIFYVSGNFSILNNIFLFVPQFALRRVRKTFI